MYPDWPQEIKERPAEQKCKEGKYKRCRCAAPHTESGYMPDVPVILPSKHSRNQAAAAQSEQISQCGQKIEPG